MSGQEFKSFLKNKQNIVMKRLQEGSMSELKDAQINSNHSQKSFKIANHSRDQCSLPKIEQKVASSKLIKFKARVSKPPMMKSFSVNDTVPPNRPDVIKNLISFMSCQKSMKQNTGSGHRGYSLGDQKLLKYHPSDNESLLSEGDS